MEDKALSRRIKELYAEHKGKSGAPMITADIKKEARFSHVGKNRIARIMRENGLRCKYARKYMICLITSYLALHNSWVGSMRV